MLSRRILAAVAVLCVLAAPAHAQKTKAQIISEITTLFPDNSIGAITPLGLRTVTNDIATSIMPTAPVVSGNLACFNGTTGLLQDCGVSPGGIYLTLSGDCTATSGGVLTCTKTNTVPFGSLATLVPGTGVATALGIGIGSAGAPVLFNGALGMPSSGDLANATIPVTQITGFAAGGATFLATPSSANLRTFLTDETGTGLAYFQNGALGTPSSATLTNALGLPLSGLTAQGAYTFVGNNTGSSAVPTAVDIAALTTKASPAAGDYVMLSDQAASGAWKKATVSSVGAAGSVSSIAGNTGAFTLSTGITNSTNDIRLSLTNATLLGQPSNPTGTTSATAVMMGLGVTTCRITPVYSSRLLVTIEGAFLNSSVGAIAAMVVRYGTGAGPANGAAFTGTQLTAQANYGNGGAVYQAPFSRTGIITSLTPGTAVWIDISLTASAGTSTVSGITCTAMEF